ncbi:MAG: hypothetical protein K2L99_04665, partial [Muribaculaceae bacterium]|nr:hypothetical protein [Muribaculaceae bacterium]
VRESRIPFEIKADKEELTRKKAIDAFDEMRRIASGAGLENMSPEEINAEITAARDGRKR